MLAIGGLLWYVFVVSVMLGSSTMAPGQQKGDDDMVMEIVSKHYSTGYLPLVGSYVEYEVRLTNTGDIAIENQSLWVSLVSDGNKTHSSATYSIGVLEPGKSKTLYLGPFRMEGEGRHSLFVKIDDDMTLDYHPDSFIVYRQDLIQTILIAVPLIVSGSGIVGFSLYKRRRGKHV